MTKDKRKMIVWVVAAIVLVVVAIGLSRSKNSSLAPTASQASLDTFAQCLKDKGAKFYGAFWCPHCQAQKKLFNESKNLPYIECSTPDGQGQLQVCTDAKIEGYPTWVFADGSRQEGEVTFDLLAQKTGCAIPK